MALVLIVDQDQSQCRRLRDSVAPAGNRVMTAVSARHAVALGARFQPDAVLVALDLPDADGFRVLRSVRQSSPHSAVVMMTGCGTVRSAVEAMRLGAADYVEKPVDACYVLEMLGRLSQVRNGRERSSGPEPVQHAVDRWIEVVLKSAAAPTDPNTIERWGRAIGMSAGALRARCRAAHLSARSSLNFVRMLRLVTLYDGQRPVSDLLNIVDTRTLIRFLQLGDRTQPPCVFPLSLGTFVNRQAWITNPPVLVEVRRALQIPAVVAEK
jgi:ActR/RegA family two-component response regulator